MADRPPLIVAAANGRVRDLQALLRGATHANEADAHGRTALLMATMMGHIDAVQILLAANANVHTVEATGSQSSLLCAAMNGNVAIMRLLLDAGANVNAPVRNEWTALTAAAYYGQTGAAQLLLAANADPNVQSSDGCATPMIVAAQHGFVGIVHSLLAAGAQVNTSTPQGWNALMLAASRGHLDMVQLLLSAGTDVNATAENGATVTTVAESSGQWQIVQMLRGVHPQALTTSSSTLQTSQFKQLYRGYAEPNPHAILMAAERLVRLFTARSAAVDEEATAALCAQIRDHLAVGLVSSHLALAAMALRLWTCPVTVQGVELCSMLNDALRRDVQPGIQYAVTLTEAINFYLKAKTQQQWPQDGVCFRGGGLPAEHRGFFFVGRRYRAPAFVASSFKQEVAMGFIQRIKCGEPILWTLRFGRGCKHVAFVAHNLSAATQAEYEFLVAPYTAFEVESVMWADPPTIQCPHQIVLRVALDNMIEPEDLPLAPWN